MVVVGDAHFGVGDPADEQAFHDFLAALPGVRVPASSIVGDLFDFWFEYPAVIPRRPFRTLAALAALVGRGIPVDLFGGNHDRWGGSFWSREMGIAFHPEAADLTCAGRAHARRARRRAVGLQARREGDAPPAAQPARHRHSSASCPRASASASPTASPTRWARATAPVPSPTAAAALQEAWARAFLDRRPEVDLVVVGHTHRRALVEHAPGRWYLNAGQWMGDRHYAVVTPDRIELLAWPERPAG